MESQQTPDAPVHRVREPSDLAERTVHRRAVEAVIWGMPAVNCDLMYQAMVREAKGAFNQIAYWSRLPDWKIQTLTPSWVNSSVPMRAGSISRPTPTSIGLGLCLISSHSRTQERLAVPGATRAP